MTLFPSRAAQSYVSTENSCVTLYRPTCSRSFLVSPEFHLDVHVSHVWMCEFSKMIGQKAAVRVQIVEYSKKSDISRLGLLSFHLLTGAEQTSFPSLDLSLPCSPAGAYLKGLQGAHPSCLSSTGLCFCRLAKVWHVLNQLSEARALEAWLPSTSTWDFKYCFQ